MTAPRAALTLLAVAAALAGGSCGGGEPELEPVEETSDVAPLPDWLVSVLPADTDPLGMLFGAETHTAGSGPVTFVLVRRSPGGTGAVEAPQAEVAYGRRTWRSARKATARLVPVGGAGPVRGVATRRAYVVDLRFPEPGDYWIVADPLGAEPPGLGRLTVLVP